jgi:hypothetical protein
MRDCVLDRSWRSGQDGYALVLTVRNQGGQALWSTIENVRIENNVFRGMGAGINILGRDDLHPSGRMRAVSILRNRFENVDPVAWGGSGKLVQIAGGPAGLALEGNVFSGAHTVSAISFSQPQHRADGLKVENNRFLEGEYGIHGDAAPALGKAALQMYAPDCVWSGNVMVKGPSGRAIEYPAGTTIVRGA